MFSQERTSASITASTRNTKVEVGAELSRNDLAGGLVWTWAVCSSALPRGGALTSAGSAR